MQALHTLKYDPIALYTKRLVRSEVASRGVFLNTAGARVGHMLEELGWPGVDWTEDPAKVRRTRNSTQSPSAFPWKPLPFLQVALSLVADAAVTTRPDLEMVSRCSLRKTRRLGEPNVQHRLRQNCGIALTRSCFAPEACASAH